MAETTVWCNMIYTIGFYLMLLSYICNSITGNSDMQQKSFHGLVILGFLNFFNNYNVPRR
jgi:uncharacterized membrane protein